MSKRWILLAGVAVVVVAMVTAAMAAFDAPQRRGRHGMMGPGHGPGMFGPRMMAQLEARLGLSAEQSAQVKNILESQRAKMREQRGSNREEHQALVSAIFSDQPNNAQIESLVSELANQHEQRIMEMVQTGLQLNQVLTAEQRAELHKVFQEQQQVREKMRQRFQERREKFRRPGPSPEPGAAPEEDME